MSSRGPAAGGVPPRWVAARVARPVGDLDRCTAFYRDTLRLTPRDGFTDHEGWSGVMFALPGSGELELTVGPAEPRAGSADDLLVLYAGTRDEARRCADRLVSAGVPSVASANPYWDRWGRTFLDPEGRPVVVAAIHGDPAAEVRVDLHAGDREPLRELFSLAEDSAAALDSYLAAGRVLVARLGAEIAGHLQLVDTGRARKAEIKNMAVRPDLQGRGIGGRLIEAAVRLVTEEGGSRLVVATAAADVDNLRFYQRHRFRLRSVERDAFTPESGYPPGPDIDGIPLRDRVWLDRTLAGPEGARAPAADRTRSA